ncbi:MAG: thioredoxin family protein [Pseudomonadales bacterium]|nr:thioredoxin family protein [Pseudomonadales bacterium]
MVYVRTYEAESLTRAQLDALPGLWVVEFGANWCGYCIAAQPDIEAELAEVPHISHMKVEDGPGRPLGRSFRVKLWPTLIVLKDGKEIGRVVRPASREAIRSVLPTT